MLVPRPDSETLIEAALALMPDRDRPWRILDLGLGSGCLLLTLLREFPPASGVGIELSSEALAVAPGECRSAWAWRDAPGSLAAIGGRPGWHAALGGPFDLLVSNPPYIEPGASTADAGGRPLRAAPGARWRAGRACGLSRHCAAAAPALVAPGGRILVEVGEGQASEISRIFDSAGLSMERLLEGPGRHRPRGVRPRTLKSWQRRGMRLRSGLPLGGAWSGPIGGTGRLIPLNIEP